MCHIGSYSFCRFRISGSYFISLSLLIHFDYRYIDSMDIYISETFFACMVLGKSKKKKNVKCTHLKIKCFINIILI